MKQAKETRRKDVSSMESAVATAACPHRSAQEYKRRFSSLDCTRKHSLEVKRILIKSSTSISASLAAPMY